MKSPFIRKFISHGNEADKWIHLIAGCFIYVLSFDCLVWFIGGWWAMLCALILGAIAGVAKEYFDYEKGGVVDRWDVFYTWAGVIAGQIITLLYLPIWIKC